MKPNKFKRAKIVEKIIRQAWTSLESHLKYAYKHTSEGQKFHQVAIKEYIDIIANASELY